MNDLLKVTALVISAMPMGEHDRRVLLLTAEMGKSTSTTWVWQLVTAQDGALKMY